MNKSAPIPLDILVPAELTAAAAEEVVDMITIS
jgi:hypothetical protein